MKKTLLEIVQEILNDMDSDFVNSIDDTVEAQQVAQIVKSTYAEMMSNRNWPHLKKLVQLDSLSDVSKPVYFKLPDNTKQLEKVEYDVKKLLAVNSEYKGITYKDPEAFLRIVSNRKNENKVEVVDFSGVTLSIYDNKAPDYYTSFDDVHVVMDSFDASINTTLIKSKTRCIAYLMPVWVHSDDAVPDLPDEAFSALIEEAKSTAFYALKQMANQKAEQRASRQNRWLARKAWRVSGGLKYENYGRK